VPSHGRARHALLLRTFYLIEEGRSDR
jgi:hypothetical protein